jgi:hypothetical protein
MRSNNRIAAFSGALACAFLAAGAEGANITVQNPSFELNTGVGGFPPPTSWTPLAGNTSLFTESATAVGFTTGFDGTKYAGIDGGTAVQDLNITFQPNTQYTVTLAVGDRTGFQGLAIFGLQSSTAPGTYLGTSTTVDESPAGVPVNTMKDFTYTFTTGATAPTGDVVAAFTGATNTATNNPRANVDNYRVTSSPVPEPASLGFLGVGAVGLLARRRRSIA